MLKTHTLGLTVVIALIAATSSLVPAKEETQKQIPQNAPAEKMQEWNNMKFGMFIHWGPLAPQGAKGDKIQLRAEAIKNFNPVKYNADEWAKLAKDAGMKYVILTSKHPAFYLFPLWSTSTTRSCITSPECPYSQQANPDIIGQYVKALRKEGLGIGFYYCHGGEWPRDSANADQEMDYGDEFAGKAESEAMANYLAFERAQVKELLTNYGSIDIFWFDGWYKNGSDGKPLLKMMREIKPDLIINDRGSDEFGDYLTPEDCIPSMQITAYWEPCLTIAEGHNWIPEGQRDYKEYLSLDNHWWHSGGDAKCKSTKVLLEIIGTVASKGGNILVDIGPRPDGSIVECEAELLREIGQWMKVNGEAIYGTTGSPLNRVPYWGRITAKGQKLYLLVFDWPERGAPLPLNIVNNIKSAKLLATGEDVQVNRLNSTSVELAVPTKAPSEHASVVVLDVEGDISRSASADPMTVNPDGNIILYSRDAAIFFVTPPRSFWEILQYRGKPDCLVNWTDARAYPQWGVFSPEEKKYNIEIMYKNNDDSTSNNYAITVAGNKIDAKTVATQGQFKSFQIGTVTIPKGHSVVTVKAIGTDMGYFSGEISGKLMDLRLVKLTPVK